MSLRLVALLLVCGACAAGGPSEPGSPDAGNSHQQPPDEDDDDVTPVPDAGPPPMPDAMVEQCQDEAEPNDTSPYYLGEFNDSSDTEETFDQFNLHAEGDVDLYEVDLVDGLDFSNPTIRVSIDVPEGDEYTIHASAICDGALEETSVDCHKGTPTPDGRGCESPPGTERPEQVELKLNCDGWTDEGTVEFRVAAIGPAQTCEPYRMSVRVQ